MTHREFFDALRDLSPLRVISVVGPNVFESICRVDRYALADGYLNAITDAYHWHVELGRFCALRRATRSTSAPAAACCSSSSANRRPTSVRS